MSNKKFKLLILFTISLSALLNAQTLSEVTGKRLYEHHSPTVAGSTGAGPQQSGYDFVNHDYYDSYDPVSWDGWSNGNEINLDMVEHNGPSLSMTSFGFTSGVSSIWGGNSIWGNGTSKYMLAPSGFSYDNASDVSDIFNAFDNAVATNDISGVSTNDIILGRIRNTNMYVAIKVTYAVCPPYSSGYGDTYFDFEYKYGTLSGTIVTNEKEEASIKIGPNPFQQEIHVELPFEGTKQIRIYDLKGQLAKHLTVSDRKVTIDKEEMEAGVYFIKIESDHIKPYIQKLVLLN